jgi:hypothetical protein
VLPVASSRRDLLHQESEQALFAVHVEHCIEAGPLEGTACTIYGAQRGSRVEVNLIRPEANNRTVL